MRFGSVDSATGLPLGNGLEGVLPPDNASHIGVGNVLFSARPKPGLKDGTAISESVTVVFNTNAPDPTPTVTNIVDACMPLEKGTHGIVTFDVKSSEGSGPVPRTAGGPCNERGQRSKHQPDHRT